MDPNLFHVDCDRLSEALVVIVVLSFLVERALSLLFEHRAFIKRYDGKGVKEIIAFALAALVCVYWKFDAVSIIILSEKTSLLGELITAGVIAGGSKGSLKLFRDLMGIKSRALEESEKDKKSQAGQVKGAAPTP